MKYSKAEIEAVMASSPRLHVPLSKLVLSQDYQARPEGSRPRLSIPELAASMQQNGVLQNLVVVKGPRGAYEVCAGGRRLEALTLLLGGGVLPENYPVPVLVVPADKALIASLAENVCREQLSVADELAGFLRLSAEGKSAEDIAAAFGVTPLVVKRRLKLAAVSPRLMALFREEKIGLDCLMVLASVEDHEKQEQAWAGLQPWNRHPEALRRLLSQGEVESDRDPVARYVTLKAYEKAGGATRRDLFSDDEKKVYLLDAPLLERLAGEKLRKRAKQIAPEGWKWIEVRVRFDHDEFVKYGQLRKARREPTAEEGNQLEALRAELDGLSSQIDALDQEGESESDSVDDGLAEAAERVQAKLNALEEMLVVWPADLVTQAGCVVYVGDRGVAAVKAGLIRPEDRAQMAQMAQAARQGANATSEGLVSLPSPKTRPVHAEKLVRRLSAHRVCAVQAELLARPDVALAAITAHLAVKLMHDGFRRYHDADLALTMSASETHEGLCREADDMAESAAWKLVEAERRMWFERLPTEAEALLTWVLQQDHATVGRLLTFLVSSSVGGIRSTERDEQSTDALAQALTLDMTKWWKPTGSAYLSHVSKGRILDVVTHSVGPDAAAPMAAMKKDAVVAAAELALAGAGWLPECLRTRRSPPGGEPADSNPGSADAGADPAGVESTVVVDA